MALSAGEEIAVGIWQTKVRRLLDEIGWADEVVASRLFVGGAVLAISAPIDSLYTATEVNEWAWDSTEAVLTGGEEPASLKETAERLLVEMGWEANPELLALRDAAAARGVAFLFDQHRASVGLGTGSLAWPVEDLPDPEAVDWGAVHDIPVVMVTGTNGKTTTVRLLASMVSAAGKAAGTTSTDRIEVAGEVLDEGDYSGPGGARTLLRDRRVEVAILETARGGILRRGLAVDRAKAALITNISADHLGEFGVHDLPSLASAKLVVTRVVEPGGRVVLNADDSELVAAAGRIAAPVTWFSLDAANPHIRESLAADGEACFLEEGALVLARGGEQIVVARVEEVPITFGGAARHNVANALGAIGLAAALELPVEAMAAGLRQVAGTPEDNPGRANLIERNGVHILVDYAHNPEGLLALLNIARSLPAERRLMVIGQAGDRSESAIRDLARTAWGLRPDRVIVKEMVELLRGRPAGEVPALLVDELLRLGARPESVTQAGSELEAVRDALAWARPGDLLVLLVHAQRDEVLAMVRGA
ncbi:MAG TPA: Mur ligase family protein [Thermoanaerobaculia bacterium]|nr:Mur ligase family protein [Thermoanaerobaculia bacterium]